MENMFKRSTWTMLIWKDQTNFDKMWMKSGHSGKERSSSTNVTVGYIHLPENQLPFYPYEKPRVETTGIYISCHFSIFVFRFYFIQLRAFTEESIWFGRDHFISWKNRSCEFRIVISAVHRCPTDIVWNPRLTDVLVGRR